MSTPEWRPWGILAGLFVLSAGFIAYVIAPASFLPLFMAEYSIEKPAASASISAVFLTWALLQIPGGYVMDRYDNRRLVSLGSAIFILASVGGLLIGSYSGFLLTRLVSGASVVLIFVGCVNILGRILPDARRALGMSIFIASPPTGIVIAQLTGPLLAQSYGWRTAMLAYTTLATVGYVTFLALLSEPIEAPDRITVPQFLATLRNPSVLLVSTASLCTYAVWTFLVTWMPSYGTEVLGFDLAAAGAATALVPLAGIVARPSGGWLSDLLDGRLVPIIVTSFLTSVLFLYLLSTAPSPVVFAILLALTGAAVNLAVGLYLVYINLLADASTQGTSLSVLLTFSQIGNLVAPVVGGWMIDQFSWAAGFGFAMGLAIVGLAAIVLAPSQHRGAQT